MRRSSIVLPLLMSATPANASGTIYYGSRAGMEVSVISVEGLNTSHAVIHTKHTRENAITFCRDYVGEVTEDCIRKELAIPLNDIITANCNTGEFADFHGNRYKFLGPNRARGDLVMAKYAIMDLGTREIANGSMASGYPVNMDIYRALCPARAPIDE